MALSYGVQYMCCVRDDAMILVRDNQVEAINDSYDNKAY